MLRLAKTAALVLFWVSYSMSQDWTGWRGQNRDGVAGLNAIKSLPAGVKLKWKAEIGEGHSSPVTLGSSVFTFGRKNENEFVACFDIQSGKPVWSDSYPVSYQMHPAAVTHGKGPKATPVIGDGHLYTFGITGILSCYDAASGRLVWRRDFKDQFKYTSPYYGTASSPLLDGGLVIVNIGGHDAGALTALDAATGFVKWKWTGDGPGYASPIAVDFEGVRQIVTQTQQNIVGISAATGQLLWRIPFSTEYAQNIVTPLLFNNTLILSGLDKGTFAIKVFRRGEEWTTETIWQNESVPMYMNSPVVSRGLLYGMSHKNKGQYFCLDAATGKTLWTSQGRQGDNAAMLVCGQWILALNTDAELTAIRASAAQFEAAARYTVATSATWAHPVMIDGGLLVRDSSSIAMWKFE
jgi:outer membrane protein assembly factor BamB